MSDEGTEIRVNFGKPMPLFPLAGVALMPHAVLPLHIFEERYRAMVCDALDGPGQIAMAVFEGDAWRDSYEGRPALRPAVCVGQIVQHHHLADGRYNIALHGVCRARIVTELPAEDDVAYRRAMLRPVGLDDEEAPELEAARARLATLLTAAPLSGLREAAGVAQHLGNPNIPADAVMELVAVSLLRDADMRFYNELHYELLAEGDAARRVGLIEAALHELGALLTRAERQRAAVIGPPRAKAGGPADAPAADASALPGGLKAPPRGCTWN